MTQQPIEVGQTFPKGVILKKIDNGTVSDFSTDQFGAGKYILFAVPGAFTPTCSNQHLPSYIAKADELKSKGIDGIYCLSVNDTFVMAAWGKEQDLKDEVILLADWNAHLTQLLGMTMDLNNLGMGIRSRRYAIIIDNGTVSHVCLEKVAGECTLSRAENVQSLI